MSASGQFDVSICIPTRNRAEMLKRCLEHLEAFSKFSFEIIIGDNASADKTKGVIDSYKDRFRRLVYCRHDTDLGFGRNVDSILRLAQGNYVYVLSDDDILYQDGLVGLMRLLDVFPTLVAVGGSYIGSPSTAAVRVDYGGAKLVRFLRGDYAGFAQHLMLADGHPLMRRVVFQRHGSYRQERGFGLLGLYVDMLAQGEIGFVDKPIFQHLVHRESFAGNMADSWFLDYCNADIEIGLGGLAAALPANVIESTRTAFLKLIYLHAARVSRGQNEIALMWHFLKRLKSLAGLNEPLMILCEEAFLLDIIFQRLRDMLTDSAARRVSVLPTPLMSRIRTRLAPMIPQVEWAEHRLGAARTEHEFLLLECFDDATESERGAGPVVSVADVLESSRLGSAPASLASDGTDLTIRFRLPPHVRKPTECQEFQLLMSDYG